MAGKRPWTQPGATRRGAMMGRPEVGEASAAPHIRMRCRRVLLAGGYDPGGAYWGACKPGEMLFCLYTPRQDVVRWRRAPSYLLAQASVSREFPGADFIE